MIRRLGPLLAGIGAVALFLSVTAGGGGGMGAGLGATVLAGGAVSLVIGWIRRRRPAVYAGWTPVAAVSFHPTAGHTASAPGRVARALGRVEARELASSISFGVGLGFCLMVLLLFGWVWAADFSGDLPQVMELFPIFTHPLAGLVVLGAHRARTRSTRDATEELFEACPTSQATRTAGHLLTAWVPAVVALAYLTLLTVLIATRVTVVYGSIGPRQVADLLGAAVLCVGATALGVGLARWLPWTLAPVAAVIAIGIASIRLGTAGDRVTEPLRQLSTWLNDPDVYLPFSAPHWVAHQLWVLALVAAVTVAALLRDRPQPRLLAAAAVFALAAGASGVAATRPIDTADAVRIASRIDEPSTHQRCVQAGELPICTFPSDGRLADHIAAAVTPVVAAAPRGSLAGWTVRHGSNLDRMELDPEVRDLLRREDPAEQLIPMEMVGHPAADEGARFWVALTAVGVTDDFVSGSVLSLEHRARGVVALWLATRGVEAHTASAMTSFDASRQDANAPSSRPWPDICFAGPAPVTWALTDLDAARQLLAAPEGEVAELLRTQWDRLTDPDTTTDELLAAAGLPPVPARPGHTPSGDVC